MFKTIAYPGWNASKIIIFMKLLDILQSAASNLLRNKTRTILTVLAIFIGTLTLTLTNGIGEGIKNYLNRQIDSLGASNVLFVTIKNDTTLSTSSDPQKYDPNRVKTQTSSPQAPGLSSLISPFSLRNSDLETLKQDNDIILVKAVQNANADFITSGGEKYQIDLQATTGTIFKLDLAAGKQLTKESIVNEALLPTSYLKVLGFENAESAVGKKIQLQISNQQEIKQLEATVKGVVNKSIITSSTLILNDILADTIIKFENSGKPESQTTQFSATLVQYKSGLSSTQVDSLKSRLLEKGYSAQTIKDQQQTIFAVIDALVAVLNLLAAVALISASIGIINTLFMAVQERTKEIGLMKAVGMKRQQIFILFSIEASLLGVIGSVLGTFVAVILGKIINNFAAQTLLKDFEGLELLTFQWLSILIIVGVITLIAFLSGTLPARKASRLNVIEALRYE
jgi:putative ABC transport system permease protein